MGSESGRVVNSWNFPEGLLMKAVAVRLHDRGLRGKKLERQFARIVPHWKSYFDKPISDNAIAQRADKARRYENEAPENNPALRVYWPTAGRIVRQGKKLGKREMRRIAVG